MSLVGGISMAPIFMSVSQIVAYGSLALLPLLMLEFSVVDQLSVRFRSSRSIDPEETFDFIVGKKCIHVSYLILRCVKKVSESFQNG